MGKISNGTKESLIDKVSRLRFTPEWSDFVMSLFHPDEIVEKKPRVHGLRRVAQLLIGEIGMQSTQIYQTPTPDNGFRASCLVEVTFIKNGGEETRVFTGAADASPDNVKGAYGQYAVAMSETRAEGRAYIKALGLKTCSAEEVADIEETPSTNGNKINDHQILFIKTIVERKNLNIENFVKPPKQLKDLSHNEAIEIINSLSTKEQK